MQDLILELEKDTWMIPAFFLAIRIDPLPYTVEDRQDRLLIRVPGDIHPMRIYRLGAIIGELKKVVNGVVRDIGQLYGVRAGPPADPDAGGSLHSRVS